jgi:hypothetical protein
MLIALLAAQALRGEVARRPRKVVDVDLDMVRLNIGFVIVDRLQRYGDAGQAFAEICYFPPIYWAVQKPRMPASISPHG